MESAFFKCSHALELSCNSTRILVTELVVLHTKFWREGIIIYNRTSHPSNIKTWTSIGLLLIHFKMTLSRLHFGVFEANFNVKSTLKKSNLSGAYYFMVLCWMNETYTPIQ